MIQGALQKCRRPTHPRKRSECTVVQSLLIQNILGHLSKSIMLLVSTYFHCIDVDSAFNSTFHSFLATIMFPIQQAISGLIKVKRGPCIKVKGHGH